LYSIKPSAWLINNALYAWNHFYLLYPKEVFLISMQGTWQSPNMLPTMVHVQTFCIITWQLPLRGLTTSAIRGCTEQLCGFEPTNIDKLCIDTTLCDKVGHWLELSHTRQFKKKNNASFHFISFHFKYFIDKPIGLDNRLCLYKSSPTRN
jgi:hypothetical protein